MNYKYYEDSYLENISTSNENDIYNNIYTRVINSKLIDFYEDKYSSHILYKKMLDLAVTYIIRQQDKSENCINVHMITKKDIKNMGLNRNHIIEQSNMNTNCDRKRRIYDMFQNTFSKLSCFPLLKTGQEVKKMLTVMDFENNQVPNFFDKEPGEDNPDNVLIISNKFNVLGANYIFSNSMINEISERFDNDNFYIIPTSTHEIVCARRNYVTENGKIPNYEVEDDLLDMVEQLNDEKEEQENILSYRLYYYMRDDGNKIIAIK